MIRDLLHNENGMMLIARIFVLLVCFPVHECAHAWTADRLGDPTGRRAGRITLNPFRHLDYMGTVFILLAGVGYAKPVPVNIRNFRRRKQDFALTALAGPLSNLLMAALFLLLIRLLWHNAPISGEYAQLTLRLLTYAAYINTSLAVFNLLPIPPLDGSRVLTAFLPDGAYYGILRRERYIMGILLIGMTCLSRMGYSPVGSMTRGAFDLLYRLIVLRG